MSALRYHPSFPVYYLSQHPVSSILYICLTLYYVLRGEWLSMGILGLVGIALVCISYRLYRKLYPDVLAVELEKIRSEKVRQHIMDDSVRYMYPDVITIDPKLLESNKS